MEEKNTFKVDWFPRNGEEPILRVKNTGNDAVYTVCIDIDLMDETESFRLATLNVFQAGDSNDFVFPIPEGYSNDINWEIEVDITYYKKDMIPRTVKFIKTPKLK